MDVPPDHFVSEPKLWEIYSNETYQSPGEDEVFLGDTMSSFEENSASLSRLFQDENPCLDDIQLSAPPPAVGVAGGFFNSLPGSSSGAANTVSVAFQPNTTQQGLRFTPPVQFTGADLSIIVADDVRPGGVIRGNAMAVVPSGEPSNGQPESSAGSGKRKSKFRGVSMHRRYTGRYEAYLWDTTSKMEGRARRGHQVYLGAYDKEEKAARAYDLAALKLWGSSASINFPISSYAKELEDMKNMSMEELVASIKRTSNGFIRGESMYRGVSRHHREGQWQARIGRVAGKKELYLGTFTSEVEAAEAYDIAAIKFRGKNITTNFSVNRYNVDAIKRTILPVDTNNKRPRLSRDDIAKLKLNP